MDYKPLIIILVITSSLIPNWSLIAHANQYTLKFIDVGQGDSILIRTPNNCTMFIDGGQPNYLIDQLEKHLPATENQIDLIVLSHPHLDHMGGLIQLLDRYKVKEVFTTGIDYQSSFYKKFESQIKSKVNYVKSGEYYYLCGLLIQIIHPEKRLISKEIDNVNNASIVMRIKIKDKWIFLSGDAELEQEAKILKTPFNLKSYIMKAGHHGSRTSNSQELLDAVSPEHLVIQSGEGNQYKHPHYETILKANDVNATLYRNDKQGTVTFFF